MKVADVADLREAVKAMGFRPFWNEFIRVYLAEKRPDLMGNVKSELELDFNSAVFDFDNIGDLYEISLETDNQISKKELGQYYTPKDTCEFMAKKVISLFDKNTDNLADVCCGTGNLIIEVLSLMGKERAAKIISDGSLYLYDLDETAMRVAVMKICILFIQKDDVRTFREIQQLIHIKAGNFLDKDVKLPKNCVLISNPPYGKIPDDMVVWDDSETRVTNDMYIVFIEKMSKECKNAVIISPQSFLGGAKFEPLRKVLAQYGGSVFSFDNIPCPIFVGRKKGIFNTNKINSVRAAITIVDKAQNGFRVSPMIRFKAEERKQMFAQLDNLLGNFVYTDEKAWTKVPKTLEPLVKELKNATKTVNDLVEKTVTKQRPDLKITIPSTPRYFITGSKRNLSRSSKIEIYAKTEEDFDKLYIIVNSTISYLWWRIYDGGITLTRQTLLTMPVPDMPAADLKELVAEGIKMENEHIVNKMNAGKNNENIKFPEEYRHKVNTCILSSMCLNGFEETLYSMHSNCLLPIISAWT